MVSESHRPNDYGTGTLKLHIGIIVVIPVQITRRYAEFSGAVMVLHEKFPLEGVDGLMLQLQDEVEKVILKMAAVFHNRKDQLIFLINNYDMMLSVLSVCFVRVCYITFIVSNSQGVI